MNQDAIALAIAGVMPAAIATGMFVSLATFQVPSGAIFANGMPDGTFVDVAGLVGIKCQNAPSGGAGGNIQAKQVKAETEDTFLNMSHVLLAGFYPDAETAWRMGGRMIVDGLIYANGDILGVESDSQSQMTRVEVRVATV